MTLFFSMKKSNGLIFWEIFWWYFFLKLILKFWATCWEAWESVMRDHRREDVLVPRLTGQHGVSGPVFSCTFPSVMAKNPSVLLYWVRKIGLPLWLSWERILLQCERPGFDPWVEKVPWRRERLPTPVFWPGEFHGLYSPWGWKESDTTEQLSLCFTHKIPTTWIHYLYTQKDISVHSDLIAVQLCSW